jgi:hypothetical protein
MSGNLGSCEGQGAGPKKFSRLVYRIRGYRTVRLVHSVAVRLRLTFAVCQTIGFGFVNTRSADYV